MRTTPSILGRIGAVTLTFAQLFWIFMLWYVVLVYDALYAAFLMVLFVSIIGWWLLWIHFGLAHNHVTFRRPPRFRGWWYKRIDGFA